jgi:hypothetical protein
VLVRAPCPQSPAAEGCIEPSTATIWLRPGLTRQRARAILQHELGHLYDWRYLDDVEREQFRALARIPAGAAWYEGRSLAPAERFADAYASCALGYRPSHFWSTVRPRRGRGLAICDFITSTLEANGARAHESAPEAVCARVPDGLDSAWRCPLP